MDSDAGISAQKHQRNCFSECWAPKMCKQLRTLLYPAVGSLCCYQDIGYFDVLASQFCVRHDVKP